VIEANRDPHPSALVRKRLLVLRSLHCGHTWQRASVVTVIGVATTGRIVKLYRRDEISGLLKCEPTNFPVSELAHFGREIRESFEQQPVRCNGHVLIVDAAHFIDGTFPPYVC
jgi:hypothetical protein